MSVDTPLVRDERVSGIVREFERVPIGARAQQGRRSAHELSSRRNISEASVVQVVGSLDDSRVEAIVRMEDIEVEDPCCEAWDEMDGDERRRHCQRCGSDVVNLSALTRSEARRVVLEEASPCVRFRRDSSGDVVFRDVQLGRQRRGAKELTAAVVCSIPFLLWAGIVFPLESPLLLGDLAPDESAVADIEDGSHCMAFIGAPSLDPDASEYDRLPGAGRPVLRIDEHGNPLGEPAGPPREGWSEDRVPRIVVPK